MTSEREGTCIIAIPALLEVSSGDGGRRPLALYNEGPLTIQKGRSGCTLPPIGMRVAVVWLFGKI